ncbi:MAG: hypothetical protein HZA90_25195 [Verrucomicrobia bacterium]|nr:hypothetical protein [Verrucomicrobiota bacterium]
MNRCNLFWAGLIAGCVGVSSTQADERRFTYTYEPETLPAGAFEVENWITLRTQRSKAAGRDNFNRWDLRQELEYGVSDRYTTALYLNERADSYRDPATGVNESDFEWKGVSWENRFNVLNPAAHKVGLTLYLEGRYSGEEAEIEQKIILGQRHGAWKWALNLEHATEWEDNLRETEGEFGASLGVARDLGKHWALGLECRNQTLMPAYRQVESTALFLGPTLSYRHEKWWAALTVLPQVRGWNFDGNPDGDRNFDLAHQERLQVRLLMGFNF